MTCGPRTTSSPASPTGSSFIPVSMSTILASVSGQGRPMVPLLRLPKMGFAWVTGEASDRP